MAARNSISAARGLAPSSSAVVAARHLGEGDDVAAELGAPVDGGGGGLRGADVVEVGDRLELGDEVAGGVVPEHVGLLPRIRVAELDPDHEPVELGLGKRICAGVLGGVLGRDDHERASQLVGLLIDGDPPLLHRFEQSRLRLRRGAVDLVDEHDVREDRSRVELERRLPLVEDHRPGDVRRKHVGGALDPRELGLDRTCERPGQGRLANAGTILDQDVPAGDQGDEEIAHRAIANLERPLHVGPQSLPQRLGGPRIEVRQFLHANLNRKGPSNNPGGVALSVWGFSPACG